MKTPEVHLKQFKGLLEFTPSGALVCYLPPISRGRISGLRSRLYAHLPLFSCSEWIKPGRNFRSICPRRLDPHQLQDALFFPFNVDFIRARIGFRIRCSAYSDLPRNINLSFDKNIVSFIIVYILLFES